MPEKAEEVSNVIMNKDLTDNQVRYQLFLEISDLLYKFWTSPKRDLTIVPS